MKIRVGIESSRRAVLARAAQLSAPLMVSANSLWNDQARTFSGWQSYAGHDVALDSGGFVAMAKYGRYRWTAPDYIGLAKAMAPTWYAQMDFCCEPELGCQVNARIDATVAGLLDCRQAAQSVGIPAPMPVIQGWLPQDYLSGPIWEWAEADWPALVGVGSVCRRPVAGLISILRALHDRLPPHVGLHLFGVKSSALRHLNQAAPGRVVSVDSMAWAMRARWQAVMDKTPCTGDYRAQFFADWYTRQLARVTGNGSN